MTLIIINSAPSLDLEPIELLLALAAFEQNPKVLLMGEGIFYANTLQRQSDIERFGLENDILQSTCTVLDKLTLQQLIQQSKHCVNL